MTNALSVTHLEASIDQMHRIYDLSDATVIGHGGNGVVSTCTRRDTGQTFALKTITMGSLSPQVREELRNEIDVQKSLDHPNIVRVYDSYEDLEKRQVHIFMELCTGGSLVSRLGTRHKGGYSESIAASLVSEILSAVLYCHQHGVVHRDIKLDNFMFRDESDDSPLTLIDFGFACAVQRGSETMHRDCGTPSYMAPELWSSRAGSQGETALNYDSSVDMWAVGVVTYMLLSGRRPWFSSNLQERARMIREEPPPFDAPVWGHVSDVAKDFIACLLHKEPDRRLSARHALDHAWVRKAREQVGGTRGGAEPDDANAAIHAEINAEIVQALQAFSHADELKKVALEVVAFSTPADQLEELRKVFIRMDEDCSGTISLEEFRKAMVSHPEIPHEQVLAIFEHIDINHTGEIDYCEFLAATLSSQKVMDTPSIGVAFGLLDRDRDGYLTKADLMRTLVTLSGGYTEDEVDELLISARANSLRGRGESMDSSADEDRVDELHSRPQDIKLSVHDFRYLVLSRRSSGDRLDSERLSKLVCRTTELYRDSVGSCST